MFNNVITKEIHLNKNKFSPTLSYIIKTGAGFRNPHYGNSGVTKLKDVIEFETRELYNRDIFYTMKILYDDYHIPFFYPLKFKINYTLKYLANKFNCDIDHLHCIWLTTKEEAIKRYSNNENNPTIDKILINTLEMIPISDLDKDGVLFVTGSKFSPF